MTIQHKSIGNSDLHEAKGASAATAGQVLTATGSATATFQAPAAPARTLNVAQSGGDYTSVATAITAAIALTPTSSNPVVIVVHAGTYTEAPLTLPGFISLIGVDGHDASMISASSATGTLITLGDGGVVRDMTLQGASGTGGIGLALVVGAEAEISNIIVEDCELGIKADGAGTNLRGARLELHRGSGETMDTGLSVTGGANVVIESIAIHGFDATTRVGTGVLCTGATAVVSQLGAKFADTGIDVGSSGICFASSSYLEDCDVSLTVGANAALECMSVQVIDSVTSDVDVTDATAKFRFIGGFLIHEKITEIDGADTSYTYISDTVADKSYKVQADLAVGNENNPRESSFGGGSPHVRGRNVFTNTNLEIGTWNDITSIINVDDGSSVPIFAGTGAGQTVYVGGDVQFPGFKADVTLAAVLGTGIPLQEFWNGSSWVSVGAMSTDSEAPYNQYGASALARINDEQIRFDTDVLAGVWATKVLNGETKYWVRVTLFSAITTIPEVNVLKLHTDRSEINTDGFIESFGAGEQTRKGIPLGQFYALSGSSPGNVNIEYATGITAAVTDNLFSNNQLRGRVYSTTIPFGLDTGRDMTLTIPWRPSSAAAGDVEWECEYAVLNEGSQVDGTATPVSVTAIVSITGQEDELIETALVLNTPFSVPPGLLVLSIFRDATVGNADDTYGANVELVAEPRLTGTFWR